MNILLSEKSVEVVDDGVHCGYTVGPSMCSSFLPSDAVSIIKDETELSDSEAGNSNDVIADYDVTQHIDSVFFACDPTGAGEVDVSDVIAYLSDTLHVSNCSLVTYTGKMSYILLNHLNRYYSFLLIFYMLNRLWCDSKYLLLSFCLTGLFFQLLQVKLFEVRPVPQK